MKKHLIILCSLFVYVQALFGQVEKKKVILRTDFMGAEEVHIFKVKDSSLVLVTPSDFELIKGRSLLQTQQIENLMKEDKFSVFSTEIPAERIQEIEIPKKVTRGKQVVIGMGVGGLIGLFVGLADKGRKERSCDLFSPFGVACTLNQASTLPLGSIGVGVGFGAMFGAIIPPATLKIPINRKQSSFEQQKETIRLYSILPSN